MNCLGRDMIILAVLAVALVLFILLVSELKMGG